MESEEEEGNSNVESEEEERNSDVESEDEDSDKDDDEIDSLIDTLLRLGNDSAPSKSSKVVCQWPQYHTSLK